MVLRSHKLAGLASCLEYSMAFVEEKVSPATDMIVPTGLGPARSGDNSSLASSH